MSKNCCTFSTVGASQITGMEIYVIPLFSTKVLSFGRVSAYLHDVSDYVNASLPCGFRALVFAPSSRGDFFVGFFIPVNQFQDYFFNFFAARIRKRFVIA